MFCSLALVSRHHKPFTNILRFKDPGNRSLQQQDKKIGHTPDVCTSDMIPIREASVDPQWDGIFGTKWKAIQKLSLDLSYAIMKFSPVVVLIGKACFEAFDKELQKDSSIRLVKILLGVSIKVFLQDAFFYVVKDRKSGQIRQLVFNSFHGSKFLYDCRIQDGVYTDLIWNAAAAIARINILSPDHFSWLSAKQSGNLTKERETLFIPQQRPINKRKYPDLPPDEAMRQGGITAAASARATGFKQQRDAQRNAVKAMNKIKDSIRLARSRVLLNSFDARYLLRHEVSYYNNEANAKDTYNFFAELRGWPNLWETFNGMKKGAYRKHLKVAHAYFTALRGSLDDNNQEAVSQDLRGGLKLYALWYDKDKHPYGLRCEGDGGPRRNGDNNADPNIAISIFWPHTTKAATDQNAFAQVIRDVCAQIISPLI